MATKKKKAEVTETVEVVDGSQLTVYTYPDGAPIVDWPFSVRAQPAATKKGAHEGNKAPAAKKAPVNKPAKAKKSRRKTNG